MSKVELVKQLLKLYDSAWDDDWTKEYEEILLSIGSADVESTETIDEYLDMMSIPELTKAYEQIKKYKDDQEYDPLKEYFRIQNASRVSEYEQGWADGFEEAYELLGHKI